MNGYSLQIHGQQRNVTAKGLRIGRAGGNQIKLPDPQVSARHAFVWLQNQQPFIRDEGSTNGTFVNEQKVIGPRPLQIGDAIKIGNTTLIVAPGSAGGGTNWLPWAVGGAVGIVMVIAVMMTAGNPSGDTYRLPTGVATLRPIFTPSPRTGPTSTPPLPALSPLERAELATVQIVGDSSGGSGSVVDPRGYILTNYHVAAGQSVLLVAISSSDPETPPDLIYRAEIVDWDQNLDLALLRITGNESGRSLLKELNLATISLGNSDLVKIDDEIKILGFPGVGGKTLTLTRGTVAGFHEDALGNDQGWIKTDAEISPGNSGGVAINEAGELIGVPTWVSSEGRTLGRIGILRAINLADNLLAQIP